MSNFLNNNKEQTFQNSNKKTKFSRKDIIVNYGLYFVFIILSLAALLLLNLLWHFFEINKIDISSPLNYSEALQLVVNVIFMVIVAVATIQIERRWKKIDSDEQDKRDELHRKNIELLGKKYQEEMQLDRKIHDMEIETENRKYINDLVHHSIERLDSNFSVTGIGCAIGRHTPDIYPVRYRNILTDKNDLTILMTSHKESENLIPSYLSIAIDPYKCNIILDNEVIDLDSSEYCCYLQNDILIISFNVDKNSSHGSNLLSFLNGILYYKRKHIYPSKIYVEIIAQVTDNSIQIDNTNNSKLEFRCKMKLELYPLSSFYDRGRFDCGMHCGKIEVEK